MNSSTSFRAPQAPSAPGGSIPSQRIPMQQPIAPPLCVQNAMMTKDKKPFTYTPGGIDLSEIKSPRMAKRLARNAQYEGTTGPAKPSPLANQNNPPAPLAASSLGMPVQVFPTGPPPPPPAPHSGAPPPPPPPSSLAPQSNGNATRKSPTPQNFEPPPMGCRPEIKIPPNPMAALRKVPKPEPKNDFWIEEYRKDRSKSPLVSDGNANAVSSQENQSPPSPPSPPSPIKPEISPKPNEQFSRPNMEINRPIQQTQQQSYRAQSPPKQNIQQERSVPAQQSAMNPGRTGPFQQQPQQQQQRNDSPFQNNQNLQRPLSPVRNVQTSPQQQTNRPQFIRPPPQTVVEPPTPPAQQNKPSQVGSLYIPPVAPENLVTNRQKQLQEQQQQLQNQQQQHRMMQQQQQQAQEQAQKQAQEQAQKQAQEQAQRQAQQIAQQQAQQQAQQLAQHQTQQQQQPRSPPTSGGVQTPPWLAQKQKNAKEVPEWVRETNTTPPTARQNQTSSPNIGSQEQTITGPKPQLAPLNMSVPNTNANSPGQRPPLSPLIATAPNAKERIIPIQIEQSPIKSPATPGFGPQPYHNANQQFSSVPSPAPGYTSPNRNPNQFVDQGYNNFPSQWTQQQPQRVISPPIGTQQSPQSNQGTRIIPIAIERNPVRGPISQTPTVIQNDPRSLQHQTSWGNGAPNQSKSFRILQKITDTDAAKENADEVDQPVQSQRPQYSRQMGAASNDPIPTDQMKRMQLNEQDQAFMNRVKNQVDQEIYLHNEEDPRYRGGMIPSKSFQILQNMTNWNDLQQYEYAPMARQPQRFGGQPMYQTDDQPQPYIHPSEQQVPEPKKYTGSAIPSRSFKILQAMTTPENAGPGQSDL